jgi:hypothetical protein
MYNDMWFSTQPASTKPSLAPVLAPPVDCSPAADPVPLAVSSTLLPVADDTSDLDPYPAHPFDAATLHSAILSSADRLFFVSYRPEGTLRPRWYLIQVDLAQTTDSDSSTSPLGSGTYYCHFFGKHSSDTHLFDPDSRWWPLWHRFTTNPSDGLLDFGLRHLFKPSLTPDPTRFIAWADHLPLLSDTYMLGPFSFIDPSLNPRDRTPSSRQYLALPLWTALTDLCTDRGVIPPSFPPSPPFATLPSSNP